MTILFITTNMSLVMIDVMQTLYTTVDSKDLVIHSYSYCTYFMIYVDTNTMNGSFD